jgi:acyl carrier protein
MDQQIRAFIIDNFLFGQGGENLSSDDSFLEKGIIDSTGVLELVNFLEETFKIKVEDEDLLPENLDSVNKVVSFLSRKLQK